MIKRLLESKLVDAINNMPVVALLGPRQVGKTTLALEVAKLIDKSSHYLDLELDSDIAKLSDAQAYLERFKGKLLIIDEVQRQPDLFRLLRSLVDSRKRSGERSAQFLLLGSASRDLIQHSSETLAGRIRFIELTPFSVSELSAQNEYQYNMEKHWLRGGFPDSCLATSDDQSWSWRGDFISSYIERDIPLMGPHIQPVTMRRLWTMLAHNNGQQANYSKLGESIGVNYKTIKSYIDTLSEFYMVRQLQPWSGNTKKRLVKAPKIYLRDSGIAHRFLTITDFESLLGHPVIGASWEAFVIENVLGQLSDKWQYSYYRTSAQAEIDLVLEGPNKQILAVEIKRSLSPSVSKGFYYACDDINATHKFIIYPGKERYPTVNNVEVMGLIEFVNYGQLWGHN
ncbi:MAG: ATP-binding protein [Gammaproteobacteria bacterium]|uniref:ATP-binding protein n=1 Tax=Candidatus Thiopontia autotrophica TaxID=2841688 RepID=A0A8J6NW81_9GAMM|nr:ATP-binding protein [Candidatus Thiopontia autotrophica]MBL6985339.1 ATP-binding protein [Candidatus Thioglobus sp.]